MRKRYIFNIVLILIVTAAVMYFVLRDNMDVVVSSITQMNPIALIAVLGLGSLYTVVWGFVYYVFGKKYNPDYKIKDGIAVAFVGSFFAGITPSATGGQFGQAFVLNKQNVKVSDSVSLLWADFIIYQSTMMVYVTILFALKYNEYLAQSSWFLMILLGYIINVIVILTLYTIALFPKAYVRLLGWLARVLAKLPFIKDPDALVLNWTMQAQSITKEVKTLSQDKDAS